MLLKLACNDSIVSGCKVHIEMQQDFKTFSSSYAYTDLRERETVILYCHFSKTCTYHVRESISRAHLCAVQGVLVLCVCQPSGHDRVHEPAGVPGAGPLEEGTPPAQRGRAGAPPGKPLLQPAPVPPPLALPQLAPAVAAFSAR